MIVVDCAVLTINIKKMKRISFITGKFLIFAMFISTMFFTVTSCREKEKPQTVIIEKQVETPKQTPKAEKSEGTSISIDGKGVEFSTKKGDKETEISIKD